MGWLDFAILGVLIASIVLGLKKGLLRGIFSLAGIIVGLVIASRFYKNFMVFEAIFKNPVLARTISFLLIFTGIAAVFSIIGMLVHKFVKAGGLGMLDHLGGFIFGFLEGIAVTGIILFLLSKFAFFQKLMDKSPVASVILRIFRNVLYLIWSKPETTEYI